MRRGLFINIPYNTVAAIDENFIEAFNISDRIVLDGSLTTKENILTEIDNIILKSRYGDEIILYMSCRCDNFKNQILTYDQKNITSQELEEKIFKNRNITITIIIDCFNLNSLFKLPYKYITPDQYIEISSFTLGRKILFLSSYSLQHGLLTQLLLDCKNKEKTKWHEIIDDISRKCSLKNVICATSTLQQLDNIVIF